MANPFSDDVQSAGIGRFSSTMLGQSGARKRVRSSDGANRTTYDLSKGNESFPQATNVALPDVELTTGVLPENIYTAVFAYFQSRGASKSNAGAMATILIDTSRLSGVSPMKLIDSNNTHTFINPQSYPDLNILRDVGEQQETVSNVTNDGSLKSRLIRA